MDLSIMKTAVNVLHVIADQHQAKILGAAGDRQVKTPNLDRFALQGVRFTDAYTQSPICTPSRTSILSGQYPHNHGYYGLSGPRPMALPSFLSHFKAHNYRTAAIGCVHTPSVPRNWLETHVDGFLDYSESVDGKPWKTPFYDELRARGVMEKEDNYYFFHKPELSMEGMPSQLPYRDSQEAWSVRQAIRLMEDRSKPFCLQVAFQRPHQPFTPAQEFWDMYPADLELPGTLNQSPSGRPPHFQHAWRQFHASTGALEPRTFDAMAKRLWRGYLACITQVDYAMGELLAFLDRTGLAQNTIVIYHADHGGYSGSHGIHEKAPGICSQAVCKVPFIWRVPEVSLAGHVCTQLVESIDVAPTIAALCGLPAMETVDGHDLTPLLRGGQKGPREVAVTENPWSRGMRWKNWRFVHYQPEMFNGQDIGELYDLAADPDESTNLYNVPQHRETVHQCRRVLLEWLIRTLRVATIWPPRTCPDITNSHTYDYATTGDGKESNASGARLRMERGELSYL
jgi:choline-sulfatase/uncharacterized sulfatase